MLWSLGRDGWVALAFEDAATAMLAAVAGYPVANSCLPAQPDSPPCGPSSSARAWPPWTGCGAGPVGAEAGLG